MDVVDLRRTPLELRHRVISSGHLLYEREPERVSDFIEATMLRYFDFRHVLETYHRESAESLDHDYAT